MVFSLKRSTLDSYRNHGLHRPWRLFYETTDLWRSHSGVLSRVLPDVDPRLRSPSFIAFFLHRHSDLGKNLQTLTKSGCGEDPPKGWKTGCHPSVCQWLDGSLRRASLYD